MIHFLTTHFGRHTVDEYLCWKGAAARDILRPVTYPQAARLWAKDDPPSGVYLFSDLERLSLEDEKKAADLWERLQKDPGRWLTVNRPGRTLRRLELLRRFHAAGINRHRAWPLLEPPPGDVRYPVFLRVADDHDGARSGLLRDAGEFGRALDALRRNGLDLSGWIACEYVGESRPDGLHAKYAVFRLDGEVFPRGILFGPRWQVKLPERFGEKLMSEEVEFVRTNPHRKVLERAFDLAGADYGRLDYGVDGQGRVSVWEINTNPQIYSLAVAAEPTRSAFNDHWNHGFLERLGRLDARRPGLSVPPGGFRRFYWDLLRFFAPRLGAGRVERSLRNTGFKLVCRCSP